MFLLSCFALLALSALIPLISPIMPPKQKRLTAKQSAFVQFVAKGQTLTAAYIAAYNTSTMNNATVRISACRLMANPNITLAVEQARIAQDRANIASGLSDRERVLNRLRKLLDDAEGTPAEAINLKAADLLGKSVGLYRDVVEVETHESASEIRQELERRLAALTAQNAVPLLEDGGDSSA